MVLWTVVASARNRCDSPWVDIYICPGQRSPRAVGAAPLLEPPERVAIYKVGGAAVGCAGRLGIRDKRAREVAVPVPRSRRLPAEC